MVARCIKTYGADFIIDKAYHIKQNDTFGIWVTGENGDVYFDDEEELKEYFIY